VEISDTNRCIQVISKDLKLADVLVVYDKLRKVKSYIDRWATIVLRKVAHKIIFVYTCMCVCAKILKFTAY